MLLLLTQLGFTLTDEWRYLVTDKNKKHFNVEWDESRGRFALVVDLKHMEAMGGEPSVAPGCSPCVSLDGGWSARGALGRSHGLENLVFSRRN